MKMAYKDYSPIQYEWITDKDKYTQFFKESLVQAINAEFGLKLDTSNISSKNGVSKIKSKNAKAGEKNRKTTCQALN